MRIVYYSTPWFMDCDLPLIKALHQKGHEIYYLLSVNPHSQNATILGNCTLKNEFGLFPAKEYTCLQRFKDYFPLENWYIVNDPQGTAKGISGLLNSAKLVNKVSQLISSLKCDILHVSGIQRNFGLLLSYRFRAKLVTTMHDPIPHDPSSISKFRYWSAWLYFRLPRRIILLNKQQTQAFCKRYSLSAKNIDYARLGVYDCMSLFNKGQIKIDKPFVLFFGRIQHYKGVDLLIKAMKMVHASLPELKLVVAGKGDVKEVIDKSYTTFINEYISTEDLAGLLKDALFTICPYLTATQSGVISTAFAMNSPVLSTNVGGMKESIKDGETGILIEPNNEMKLANAIIDLYKNENLRNQIKLNIKEEVETGYYSWNKIAEIYIASYNKITK